MSEYLSSLDPVARGRYLKRLEVLGLMENDDPYTEENSGRFIDDIASWNMDTYFATLWSVQESTQDKN